MNRYRKSKKKTHWGVISAYLKLRIYRVLAILILGLASLLLIGGKVVELDRYLDHQMERLKQRR